jgi:hypothetical protein
MNKNPLHKGIMFDDFKFNNLNLELSDNLLEREREREREREII